MTVSDLPPFNFAGRGVSQEIDGNLRIRSSAAGQGLLTVDGASTLTGAVAANGGLAVAGGTGLTGGKLINTLASEPTGALGATLPRKLASGTSVAFASGTVGVMAIELDAGVVVTNISLFSVGAESGGTHAWVGICDNTTNHVIKGISADNVGAAYFAANTFTTTALAAAFTTTYTGLHYIFVCSTNSAGAQPTFAAGPAIAHANLAIQAPVLCGTALTGQTTPPANGTNLGAFTGLATSNIYAVIT